MSRLAFAQSQSSPSWVLVNAETYALASIGGSPASAGPPSAVPPPIAASTVVPESTTAPGQPTPSARLPDGVVECPRGCSHLRELRSFLLVDVPQDKPVDRSVDGVEVPPHLAVARHPRRDGHLSSQLQPLSLLRCRVRVGNKHLRQGNDPL